VIAGTGSNGHERGGPTLQACRIGRCRCVVAREPVLQQATQKGLYLHFRTIADSVGIPCVLYNIKGRTGVNLETDTLVRLAADCPNIIAVKEASGNLDQMKDVIARSPEHFCVLSGDDNMAVDLVAAGGDGVISVASNLILHRCVR
jgi:4-hydroxy-tetrahydrodipicolinate synthase